METKEAFSILGLDLQATSHEIEEKFRILAKEAHPDKGGTAEAMSEINEARATALKSIADSTSLVPVNLVRDLVAASQAESNKQQNLTKRVVESREEISRRSTNKLRKYRRVSGILGAIAAGALFLGNQFPTEIFSPSIPQSELNNMDMVEREALETHVIDKREEVTRLWLGICFGIAIYAGLGAWYFTFRIDRAEESLKELEDQTRTKALMYKFLREIIPDKIGTGWDLDELCHGIEIWAVRSGNFKKLINEVGPLKLSSFLMDRAMEIGLVVSSESTNDGHFEEIYSIIST